MLVPGSVNPLLLTSAAGAAAGGISRSLRFNSSDSAYLSRTPASAGNRTTWTLSTWVKRSTIGGSYQNILSAANSVSDRYEVYFDTSTNQLTGEIRIGGTGYIITTTQVFRDPSAWYHILVVMDTSQATASNRHKFYVNGTQVTNFASASYPNQNATPQWNAADPHSIGRYQNGAGQYFSGYLADIHFIDGQALTPTSFGEFDATTGVWNPKAYTGSYGTNGFHLTFSDNSGTTSTTLGKDSAGSNNWTPNNFSVASGSGNDSLVDVPTNGSQVDSGIGGEVRGNYCTLNPLKTTFSGDGGLPSHSNGNLDVTGSGGTSNTVGTIGVSSGKFYYEVTLTATHDSNACIFGLGQSATAYSNNFGLRPSGSFGGTIISGSAFTFGVGDTVGIAYEPGVSATFYKNNNASSFVASLSSGIWFPWAQLGGTTVSAVCNFGQRPFVNQSVPSGYKALCTANLPAPLVTKPSTVFDVKLYTGNYSTQTISGLGFSPDFVWLKARSAAERNVLFDQVRGAGYRLLSDGTESEALETNTLSAFTSDGFSVGVSNGVNGSGTSMVAWAWDAGSSTVTNTQGSITSSVRANATAGISIIGYTGTGANATVGHGLGVTPGLLICKSRTQSGGSNWVVWHSSFTGSEFLRLNTTDSKQTASVVFNSTAPSSTVISLGTDAATNGNGNTHIIYAFAPVVGYSSFGSYTGNGSADGPFVYTGFRPKFIITKVYAGDTGHWIMCDTARSTYNVAAPSLFANGSGDETGSTYGNAYDILSNGFKLRTSSGGLNLNTASFLYIAFAESPFQYARAR